MLKGEKVVLRPLRKEDVDLFVVWMNDPEVTQYLSMFKPVTRISEEKWIERTSQSDSDIVLVIEAIKDGKNVPIGNCGLHRITSIDRDANFGIFIGEKDYWSNGYGTEAARVLIEYAFKCLNLRRISSSAIAFNERSVKMHKKIGFKEEGKRREKFFKNGKFHDEIMFGLLRKDWKKSS